MSGKHFELCFRYYLLLAVAMRDCHAMFPAAHVEEFISKQGGDMPAAGL